MHSSRMRTIRCRGHPEGVYPSMHWAGCVYPSMNWAGGVSAGGGLPGVWGCISQHALGRGCLPQCMLGYIHPCGQNS